MTEAEIQAEINLIKDELRERRIKELEAELGQSTPEADFTSAILPYSRTGGVSRFDSDAGLLGIAKRAVTLPRDVIQGRVNPEGRETIGRMAEAASVMSPVGPGIRAGLMARQALARQRAPSRAQLKQATSEGYTKAGEMGVEYTTKAVKTFADDLERELGSLSAIEPLNPELYGLIRSLQNQPPGAVSAPLKSLDGFRQQLNKLAGNQDGNKAFAAQHALDKLDDFLGAADPTSVVVGAAAPGRSPLPVPYGQTVSARSPQAAEAIKTLSDARANAAAGFRSDRLTGVERAIDLRTAAANSGMNVDNTVRARLASMLLNKNQMRGFNAEETAAIESIVRGTATKNTLRRVGNMLGAGGGLGQTLMIAAAAGGGGAMAGGPGAAIAAGIPALAGTTARMTANQMSKQGMKRVDEMVRSRSPLAQKLVEDAPPMLRQTPMRFPEGKGVLLRSLIEQFLEADPWRQSPDAGTAPVSQKQFDAYHAAGGA